MPCRSQQSTELEKLYQSAALKLFGRISCEATKCTMDLAALVFSAESPHAATRSEFRDALSRIKQLAEELASLLGSYDVRTLAPGLAGILAMEGADSPQILLRVVCLAEEQLSNMGTGAGRGSAAAATGRPTPQVQCAAAVAEVWRRTRGRYPSHGDDNARAACAALWSLADGRVTEKAKAGDTDEMTMWDRHIRTVAKALGLNKSPTRRPRGEQRNHGEKGPLRAAVWTARDNASRVLDGYEIALENAEFRTATPDLGSE